MPAISVQNLLDSLTAWMREDVDQTVAFDAISDSIISIWETLICINLSEFLGGPITATFAPAAGIGNFSTYQVPADADAGVEGGTVGDQDDIWYIHSMSMQVTDGTERFWEGAEVGSELWKKMARSLAGASPFQPYVYDFDGKQFSIAPKAAQGLTPGYFYVKRPPVTVNAATIIPFQHPGAALFIRYNALALMKLSLEEYIAAGSWNSKAEAERNAIIQTAARKNARKNLRVQPLFK